MELIIILIILRIFYSLFQSVQRGRGEPRPPQRPPVPSLPPDFGDSRAEEEYRKIEDIFPDTRDEMKIPEKKQPAEIPADKAMMQPLFAEAESRLLQQTAVGSRKSASFLTEKSLLSRATYSRPQQDDLQKRESALSPLLNKDNLFWGIVALEVLSPPRARKTFPFKRFK